MDWYPLWNSLRIAAISSVIVFFTGIAAAYYVAKLPRLLKGILDVVLTLPLVLPPTVCGWLLLLVFGLRHPLGQCLQQWGIQFVMTWYGGIIASAVVAFPLMYRTARGAFESFDETLAWSGKTLGLSDTFIFWRIRMPYCKQGIIAGTVHRLCPGSWRIRRNEHAHWLHPQEYGHYFDDSLSTLADERRIQYFYLGSRQHGH